MIGRDHLLDLLSAAVGRSRAESTEIRAEAVHQGVTRYAGSTIHQTTVVNELQVSVRAVVGKSVGDATGNSLIPGDIDQLVGQAVEVARMREPNPEFVSLPRGGPLPEVTGYDEGTAWLSSERRAEAIRTIAEMTAERGWTVSGTYLSEGREAAVVNSCGVSAYVPRSVAFLRALPDSGSGTGYADGLSYRAEDLAPVDIAQRAMRGCERNREQRDVPPGAYEAILGESCVAEALSFLAAHGFNGQAYEEGRSFVSGRLGTNVTGPNVTIWDDGTDARNLAVPADNEGVPKRYLPLIESGVARSVAYDSFTAFRVGRESTGHAVGGGRANYYGPVPVNLFMQGGTATVDEMIQRTERGLLLTRFHYTHCPDPKRVVLTGTTRDGTFLIEHGEIVGAVKNLRLTQSVPELFEGIEMLGTPRLVQDWWSSNGMGRITSHCPPVKVKRALFTSGTLF